MITGRRQNCICGVEGKIPNTLTCLCVTRAVNIHSLPTLDLADWRHGTILRRLEGYGKIPVVLWRLGGVVVMMILWW